MSKTFKLNRAGVRQLMQSTEMQAILQEKASQITARCGDGYEHDVMVGKNRANAMVTASTDAAKRDNSKNNTILKAVRG